MQSLRTHTARIFAITFVLAGIGLYVAQPAQAQRATRSFASWFTHIAEETDAADLTRELHRLKDSGVKLNQLIEHASQVISRHNKGFNLPLEGATGSHQIYQILLAQWSQFQTGSGMGNIPLPENVKSGLSLQVDKSGTLWSGKFASLVPVMYAKNEMGTVAEYFVYTRPATPMAMGIAIGAP